MLTAMIVVFVLGYLAIVFEHQIHINKAASAIVTGVLCWTIYAIGYDQLVPQAAFEAMKASAENGIAIATKNLKDVTALGVAHFHSGVDVIEKAHPAPEVFANIGKGLKSAASAVENALDSAVKTGTAAVKKARAA